MRENEDGKKRQKEKVKYVIIPNGQSLSFFQDTEIHLDLHQTAGAIAMSTEEKNVTASYMQSSLCETWEPYSITALAHSLT